MEDAGYTAVMCRSCKHYQVSWDPGKPHACIVLGFKSRQLPCLVVYESSGLECQFHEPKPRRVSERA